MFTQRQTPIIQKIQKTVVLRPSFIHTFIHSYIHTFVHSYIRTFVHSYIRTFVHSYIRTFVHSYIRTFAHSHIRTFAHSYIRTFVHSYIRTFVHSYIRTFVHSYIRTFVHSYIHTFIHSYIHVSQQHAVRTHKRADARVTACTCSVCSNVVAHATHGASSSLPSSLVLLPSPAFSFTRTCAALTRFSFSSRRSWLWQGSWDWSHLSMSWVWCSLQRVLPQTRARLWGRPLVGPISLPLDSRSRLFCHARCSDGSTYFLRWLRRSQHVH